MRTVGLVLFLQVLTLLSVLHCFRQPVMLTLCSVTALSVQPCVVTRRYARHDLLSLETAATPPPFLSPQLITRLSHLGLARNVPSNESTAIEKRRRGGKNERRKIKVIVGIRDRLPSDSSSSSTPSHQPAEFQFSSPPSL